MTASQLSEKQLKLSFESVVSILNILIKGNFQSKFECKAIKNKIQNKNKPKQKQKTKTKNKTKNKQKQNKNKKQKNQNKKQNTK